MTKNILKNCDLYPGIFVTMSYVDKWLKILNISL